MLLWLLWLLLIKVAATVAAAATWTMLQRTSHAVHAGEPLAQLVAHVLAGRRRWAERPERRRPGLVMVLMVVLVVPPVPVVSAARDSHAASDAPPEPIAAPGTRPPPAAQAPGQHQRQHRAHGQHRRQHHVVHGFRFHRTCQTAHACAHGDVVEVVKRSYILCVYIYAVGRDMLRGSFAVSGREQWHKLWWDREVGVM